MGFFDFSKFSNVAFTRRTNSPEGDTLSPSGLRALMELGARTAVIGAPTAADVTNVPAGGIIATDVQAAINELDFEKQTKDATLTGLAAIVVTNDTLPYGNGADTFALTPFTAAARTLLDDATVGDMRTTLGLGTLATQSGTFSGTSSGTNTGDQTITLTGDVTGSGTGSFAATVANNAVNYAKMQDVSGASLLIGRGAGAGAGDPQEITVGSGLTMTGTTLSTTGGGTGTVTSVSVVSANGLAGTVATATTTPAITLSTTVTGLLKGNGTAISAATAGTDYAVTKADVSLGSVTNDAQTKAAIVPNTVPTAGQILAGNAGATAYAPVSMSGDVTMTSAGVATIANTKKILANVTLGVAGTSLSSGTITARKFLEIRIFIAGYAGSDTASLQFNAAAGTAYRYRWLSIAAAATTFTTGNAAVSTDRIKIDATDTTRSRNVTVTIVNDATVTEKIVLFPAAGFGTTSAGTQATKSFGDGAWVSGAATQITRIDLISTSNMTAGTQMTIFGWD